MPVSAILLAGLQGLQAGINRTNIAATSLNVENNDFASRMVAMKQGEIDVKAAANIIKTADQILGTIIDIRG